MKRYLEYLAESKTPQSGYIKESSIPTKEDRWIDIIDTVLTNKYLYNEKTYQSLLSEIKKLIDEGVDINIRGNYGYTLLMKVATGGLEDIFDILINQPNIDINIKNDDNCTALIGAGTDGRAEITAELLKRPEIDVTAEATGWRGWYGNFIDIQNKLGRYNEYLKEYDLQTKIIENGREDIILFLDKYKLVHPEIRKNYPDLFAAKDWGLI